MNFVYRPAFGGDPIPPDRTLAALGITDGATVMLEVQIEQFGPDRSFPQVVYRNAESSAGHSPATSRALINSAFGHLMPW